MPATTTQATNISPNVEYNAATAISSNGAIYVELDDYEDYIGNVKSQNSSLKAKVTDISSYYSNGPYHMESAPSAVIGLYATKKLSTVVTFDVFDANGNKKSLVPYLLLHCVHYYF